MDIRRMIVTGILGGERFDYYVTKDGNDTSGNGSRETPWLTIKKALTTIPIGGGTVIGVGAGVYAENSGSGYLSITKAYTRMVTIKPLPGASVTLTNASGAYALFITGANANFTFQNINILAANGTTYTIYPYSNNAVQTGICFVNCNITSDPTTDDCRLFQPEIYQTPVINYTFKNCTMTSEFTGAHAAINLANVPVNVTVNFANCTMVCEIRLGLVFYGGTINIDGGSYSSEALAVRVGVDGTTLTTTLGHALNMLVSSGGTHGILIGGGCLNFEAAYNTINSTGEVVLKGGTGTLFHHNTLNIGGSGYPALLMKGAIGAIVQYNTLISQDGYGFINYDGDVTYQSQNCQITYNTISQVDGSDGVIYWVADGDAGGNVIDYNQYSLPGTTWGNILGTTVTNLASARAAWSGYGDGTNDSHSTVV